MNKLDYEEIKKHINILNVAYHLNIEIVEQTGFEYRAICPFCGHRKLTKTPTLSLNSQTNQFCCSSCGKGGHSTDLYAKIMNKDKQTALIELMERECFSQNREKYEITFVNQIEDVIVRDAVYRDFLDMLKLDSKHKKELENLGFLDSTIRDNLYKSVPKTNVMRRIICYRLAKKHNLSRYSWILYGR